MSALDPVTELDNAIATAYMLAAQIGAAPPLIQGRYEMRRTLGRGAHGLVCEALDRHLQRSVALKLVPLRDSRTADGAAREAQTLAQFDHPNIVRIFDVGQTSDVCGLKIEIVYVVMELLKGINLRHWAADRPGQRAVLKVFLAAGEGLAAAHEQGFVHGDFKPENVVIDERGRVRVVDFGLARWGGDEVAYVAGFAASSRTLTQGPRGTPGYIAPEVFTAKGDARSDQYSFAVSLWELLVGRLPFERPGEVSAPDLGRSAASLPMPLARALQRGFAADPAARFPALRDLLGALSDGVEVEEVPDIPPPSGRWRWPVIGGLLVSAGLFASFALSGPTTAKPAVVPTVAPAPAPIPTAPPICPEVAAIVGTWEYTTAVMWAAESRFLGERGYYRVTVSPENGCNAMFQVEKHGDSSKPKYGENLEDRVVQPVARAADGTIEVTLDLKLAKPSKSSAGGQRSGLNYRHILSWTGGSLRGDWSFEQAKTRAPEMRGLLVGAGLALDFTLAEATCPGQCRLRCAGDAAASQCITQQCSGASGTVLDCGSADDNFEPPSNTLQAATEALGSVRGVTSHCRQVAQRLPGSWKIWRRPVTGTRREPELLAVDLEGVGCELSGRVRPPSGDDYEIHGWVDADSGLWRLQSIERPEEPIWALAGWDPAFGAADGGQATLVAHKLPAP